MSILRLYFGTSRTTDGIDVAKAVREQLPEADLTAKMDEAGRLTGYVLTVEFETDAKLVAAVAALTQDFEDEGLPYSLDRPRTWEGDDA